MSSRTISELASEEPQIQPSTFAPRFALARFHTGTPETREASKEKGERHVTAAERYELLLVLRDGELVKWCQVGASRVFIS